MVSIGRSMVSIGRSTVSIGDSKRRTLISENPSGNHQQMGDVSRDPQARGTPISGTHTIPIQIKGFWNGSGVLE